VMQCFAKTL